MGSGKNKTNDIIGAIYPVPMRLVNRLFDGKTKVFVKYIAHNTTKLQPRHKVVFYASHGSRKLMGEGTIEKVEFLPPEAVIARYREDLFLEADELQAYAKGSPSRTPSKEMLTLVMKKMKRYPDPISYNRPITMTGKYIYTNEYRSLMHENK